MYQPEHSAGVTAGVHCYTAPPGADSGQYQPHTYASQNNSEPAQYYHYMGPAPAQAHSYYSPVQTYAMPSHGSSQNNSLTHNDLTMKYLQNFHGQNNFGYFHQQQQPGSQQNSGQNCSGQAVSYPQPFQPSQQYSNEHVQKYPRPNIDLPQNISPNFSSDVQNFLRQFIEQFQNNPQNYADHFQIPQFSNCKSQINEQNYNSQATHISQPYNGPFQINSQGHSMPAQLNAQNPNCFPQNFHQLYNIIAQIYPQLCSIAAQNNPPNHKIAAQGCYSQSHISAQNMVAENTSMNHNIHQDQSCPHSGLSHTDAKLNQSPAGPGLVAPGNTSHPSLQSPVKDCDDRDKVFRGLGITQIVCGTLCMFFNAIGISYGNVANYAGCGIWGGILFIVTGTFGILAAKSKSRRKIIAFMVLCILSIFASLAVLLAGIVGAVAIDPFDGGCSSDRDYYLADSFNSANTCQIAFDVVISMNALQIVLAVIVLVTSIWGIKISDYCNKSNKKKMATRENMLKVMEGGQNDLAASQQHTESCMSSSALTHHELRPALMVGVAPPSSCTQPSVATHERPIPSVAAHVPVPAYYGAGYCGSSHIGHQPTLSFNSTSPSFGADPNLPTYHGSQMARMSNIPGMTFGAGFQGTNHFGSNPEAAVSISSPAFSPDYKAQSYHVREPSVTMGHVPSPAFNLQQYSASSHHGPQNTVKAYEPSVTSGAGHNVTNHHGLPDPAVLAHILLASYALECNVSGSQVPHSKIDTYIPPKDVNAAQHDVTNHYGLPDPAVLAHILLASYALECNGSKYQRAPQGQSAIIPSPPSNPEYMAMLSTDSSSQA